MPYIDYGDIVYGTTSKENLNRLHVLRNSSRRVIRQKDCLTPVFEIQWHDFVVFLTCW